VAPARAVLLDGQGARDGPAIGDGGFEILHALYWLVVRLGERRPLVLVVDDAHWVDVPSLRFLAHLQAGISDRPVGVVVGARPPDRDADRVLGVLATDPGTRLLRLRSLSVEAVEQLVRVRWPAAPAEFCRHCGELTAGNPLQLGELLRAVEARGGPPEVGALGDVAAAAARSLERAVLFLDRIIDTAVAERAHVSAEAVHTYTEEAKAGLGRLMDRLAVVTNPEVSTQQPLVEAPHLQVEVGHRWTARDR
jgi:hypothetical protein